MTFFEFAGFAFALFLSKAPFNQELSDRPSRDEDLRLSKRLSRPGLPERDCSRTVKASARETARVKRSSFAGSAIRFLPAELPAEEPACAARVEVRRSSSSSSSAEVEFISAVKLWTHRKNIFFVFIRRKGIPICARLRGLFDRSGLKNATILKALSASFGRRSCNRVSPKSDCASKLSGESSVAFLRLF